MNIVLFDDPVFRVSLLPLTYTRPVALLRTGILTIQEKWEKHLKTATSFLTQDYLQAAFPSRFGKENLYINGSLLPDSNTISQINALKAEQTLVYKDTILAVRSSKSGKDIGTIQANTSMVSFHGDPQLLRHTWDIFVNNADAIRADFDLVTKGRKSARIEDPHTVVYNAQDVFVEPGVRIKAAIINAENGPVYLGKNAEIEQGAMIRGSFALCEGARVNIGAKIRGDNTIGPYCKIGGEVSNSVIMGYSNKAHDGFMGNSVIGEFCNMGAGTDISNLKNNYTNIHVWSYLDNGFVDTGRQFCGLVMGDHSKCGINTMFNTGTTVGVGANIFGGGFPGKLVPSFTWGGINRMDAYRMDKFFEVMERVFERREKQLTPTDKSIMEAIFEQSEKYRNLGKIKQVQ